MNSRPNQVAFISHGGGPLPLLGDPAHRDLVKQLHLLSQRVAKPSAIVVISAHWEEGLPTITATAKPTLIYDYYGFPAESYEIQYPCPGAPELANQLASHLQHQRISNVLNNSRGLDHGVFVPLKLMYPDADIPCLQISLLKGLNTLQHLQLGQALKSVSNQGILFLGSGFSFHNLPAFFSPASLAEQRDIEDFDNWLVETCTSTKLSEDERQQRLLNWDLAPGATFCHPREEHLLPLHVCYGIAGKAAAQVDRFDILGKPASAFQW